VPGLGLDSGSILGGFRLERRLGKGGMGEVFLATQLSVKRQVALKILPGSFAASPQAVQRFLHEGRLAAKLDHFHIVTVFEAGEDNGHYYLAMAYIEGESLAQRLQRDKVLPEAEVLAIARTVADALAYAWEAFQLLHRDLKPGNLMVDRRGRVFLMDLGLAKSLGDEDGMTLSGAILGTPQYMSPEQAQGRTDLGVPTDVYALGATLYHLVTGAPPFAGETTLAVLHKLLHEPLPPARERNPEVSVACSQLIAAMMAKEPAGRYRDWRVLIADIDRVLQGALPAAAGRVMPPPPSAAAAWLSRGLLTAAIVALAAVAGTVARRHGQAAALDGAAGAARAIAAGAADSYRTIPDLGLDLVWVAPGSFQMGSGDGDAKPVHPVRISRGYWVGKYEVTQAEYRVITGKDPSHFKGARNPVEQVSWQDALAFCAALTERERAAGRLPAAYVYRLPTEAEWEYAARGGILARGYTYAGSDDPYDAAWHAANSAERTHAVGQKQPNELGLHDMSGNVWEWCLDAHDDSYYARSSAVDPVNTAAPTHRVIRGGGWNFDAGFLPPAFRARDLPTHAWGYVGFRVFLAPQSDGK
jgi:formylglycine-generating enzyme required for sulfatase activity/predicted Ser/Thr protein kinase